MIGSVADDRTWQLVITYSGRAYLCDRDEVPKRQPRSFRHYADGVEIGDPRVWEDIAREHERDHRLLKERSDLIYIRFESFCEGNGYVGTQAARDDRFVNDVYNDLLDNWPIPKHGFTYIDF